MDYEGDQPYKPRPSSAGPDKCIRQMVYHGLEYTKKALGGRAVTIFSDSSFHEELTLDWIRKSAFQVHSGQMELTCFVVDDKPVKGSIDGIITDMMMKDRLLEHKGINHFTFEQFKKDKLPLDYITQCCAYVNGLQEFNPNINEALLLIKNKNTSAYLEFIIEYDVEKDMALVKEMTASDGEYRAINLEIPFIISNAIKKFEKVNKHIRDKILPKRQYDIDGDWQCSYCGWGGTCWDGYEEEIAQMKESVNIEDMDLIEKLILYRDQGVAFNNCKKEKDLTKPILIKELIDREIQQGVYKDPKTGKRYTFKLKTAARTYVDLDSLPPDARKAAEYVKSHKELRQREIKPPKEKKK